MSIHSSTLYYCVSENKPLLWKLTNNVGLRVCIYGHNIIRNRDLTSSFSFSFKKIIKDVGLQKCTYGYNIIRNSAWTILLTKAVNHFHENLP